MNKSPLTWFSIVWTLLYSSSLLVNANKKPHKKPGNLKHPFLEEDKLAAFFTGISGGATTKQSAKLVEKATTESLEPYIPLNESPTVQKNDGALLLRDISMLTEILLDVVEQDDPKVRELYNEFLGYGKQR